MGRYSRQQDIVPMNKVVDSHCVVIGCGAIGSLVALQLARIGTKRITLVDFDTVDEVNLACQGFRECDLGKAKTDAIEEQIKEINKECVVDKYRERFNDTISVKDKFIFCCVDSISTREAIWKKINDQVAFFVDGRMKGGDTLRVVTSFDEVSKDYYPLTLFKEEEAVQLSCTAKSTIYAANIAAGYMVNQFVLFIQDNFLIIEKDFLINLRSMEISINIEKATRGTSPEDAVAQLTSKIPEETSEEIEHVEAEA